MPDLKESFQRALGGRFRPLTFFIAGFLAIATLIRTTLLIKSRALIPAGILSLLTIFGVGLLYDLITASYFSIPIILYLMAVPNRWYRSRLHKPVFFVLVFVTLYLLVFDAFAEYIFFDEFGTRFNFIAVDYLVYTTEVIRNIRESYPLTELLIAIGLVCTVIVLAFRKTISASLAAHEPLKTRMFKGFAFLLLPVLSLCFVDQSLTRISPNPYANELASNGIYNFFAALKNNSLDYYTFYRSMPDADALIRLKHELGEEKNARFLSDNFQDIRRQITNAGPEKKLNIVVIMVESLSAEFLGTFGNKENLTPNLDRIARHSLLFRQAYATGTRTDRGLEAVTLSVPPTPGRSIVKRPDNENLFAWGRLMRNKGYESLFLYGGYGFFDNMNYFFGNNGYKTIDRASIRQKDIHFENVWGVCDEDLFTKAISEITIVHTEGKPFFAHIMTTSNHRPYTYPEGRIDIPSKTGRAGAVKYTDYAIGKFISEAEKQPWFADTVFVIVADHCASSAGKTDLPPDRYHIPLIVYSPAHITPRAFDKVVSQIDIAPTILGLLNFSYMSKFLGRDVLHAHQKEEGEAFIGTYQKLGYIDDGMLVILDLKQQVGIRKLADLSPVPFLSAVGQEVTDEAVSYYQSANYLFNRRLNLWEQ